MPRNIRVLTTAFGPAGSGPRDTVERNRELACRQVGIAGRQRADLVCLPEDFLTPPGTPLAGAHAEPVDGPTFDALSWLAREHRLWIVACWYVPRPDIEGGIENSAVVIDRTGALAARYVKIHPTISECREVGSVPGGDPVVVETDFGRMGLAICYDIGWPEHWAELARRGAELVVWPSAYDGGFPLRAYAWTHGYRIVSSVLSRNAKVIDITGGVVASTSQWHPLAAVTLDLEKELFHVNYHEEKLVRIQEEIGERVIVETFDEEGFFTLQSLDPACPLATIKARYGLEDFRDYHARAGRIQDEHRPRAGAAARR